MAIEVGVGKIVIRACDYDSIYFLGEKIAECLEEHGVPECARIEVNLTWIVEEEDQDSEPST